jgi:hypothetical protein
MPLELARPVCDGAGMKRALLPPVLVMLVMPTLAVLPVWPAVAAPGGDAFVVTSTLTLGAADLQGTGSVMCPDGSRALGGGAAPTAPSPGEERFLRVFYSAPLEASGLSSQTDAGDVPRGWMVSVGHNPALSDTYKVFVVCSSSSDAVLASVTPPLASPLVATVPCPAGMRAVGGGVGKNNDTPIPANTQGPYLMQTGPVDGSGTVAGTTDDDVPVGWRSATFTSVYGQRFFAVCSTQTDAVVRTATYTVADDTVVGTATVTCPAGTRVLSGGDQVDGTVGSDDRLGRLGPYAAGLIDQATTGSVARSWTSGSRGAPGGARTHKVFAVCATDTPAPPPADTTPPPTTITKGPAKKTFASKATFKFTSEAGATFTCQLDKKPTKPCTSPYKVKHLKVGKHKVVITATDKAGNHDLTPATYKWKVLAPRDG